MFAGTYAPDGWQFCNGQSLSINDNAALYALLGVTYGGNGTTNFNLPDLRGLLVCGAGKPTWSNNTYALGQSFGVANVTLTQSQLPQHTHSMLASTQNATSSSPAGNMLAVPAFATPPANPIFYYVAGTATGVQFRNPAATMVTQAGSNSAHSNLMQTLSVNYIICTQGLFPPSN